jgi:20S proteasome alpha/beta subunit
VNKQTARRMAESGKVTLGVLRKALRETSSFPSWQMSSVNPQLSRSEALNLLADAIRADTRDDSYVMKTNRDILIATNVLREVDPETLL